MGHFVILLLEAVEPKKREIPRKAQVSGRFGYNR
jgi:hypothetical protein